MEPHAHQGTRVFVPSRITRTPPPVGAWGHYGDGAAALTWVDDPSSTIHSPYYYFWLFITKRRQRKRATA